MQIADRLHFQLQLGRIKQICVFEHSVMTNFNCACPAIQKARDLASCLKVPLDSLLVWASSGGSGETARMQRLAWTFAACIGDKYQKSLDAAQLLLNILQIQICYQYQLFIWAASWQNQQNGLCTQRRLRSACSSAQSDQSLRCPHEESLGPKLPIERTAKTLIRLGGCPGWSESSLGAQSFCWFCHEAAHLYLPFAYLVH